MTSYFNTDHLSVVDSKGNYIVNNMKLSIGEDQLLCVLGPSGSGKSTLLKAICGFSSISSGLITLKGRNITTLPPHKRGLCMMMQTPALFQHMTVMDNVMFCAKSAEYANRLVDMLGMRYAVDRYPIHLSGGEQQRVSLCRALAKEGDMLLLDEPFSALDQHIKDSAHEALVHARRSINMTGIMVTHDQEEAMKIADIMCVVRNGNLEQIDTPQAIYNNPGTKFVAQFIGKNNIMHATVESAENRKAKLYVSDLSRAIVINTNKSLYKNQEVEIAIRPEKIVLGSKAGIRGKVVSREFRGHMQLVKARLNTGYQISCMASSCFEASEVLVSWKTSKDFCVLA